MYNLFQLPVIGDHDPVPALNNVERALVIQESSGLMHVHPECQLFIQFLTTLSRKVGWYFQTG